MSRRFNMTIVTTHGPYVIEVDDVGYQETLQLIAKARAEHKPLCLGPMVIFNADDIRGVWTANVFKAEILPPGFYELQMKWMESQIGSQDDVDSANWWKKDQDDQAD